jgi:hypothetical protein
MIHSFISRDVERCGEVWIYPWSDHLGSQMGGIPIWDATVAYVHFRLRNGHSGKHTSPVATPPKSPGMVNRDISGGPNTQDMGIWRSWKGLRSRI